MRWVNATQLAIELGEDHVEMDRGALVRQHDDDRVAHAAMLERHVAEVVQGRRARPLAEAEQQEIRAQRVYVPTLERVVVPLLLGAVVQNPGVLETGVIAEQRLDEQLLGPAHAVAHRADDRVLPDHDPHVAREEQVGKRWQGVAGLVQGAGDRPRLLECPLDHHSHERLGRKGGELLRKRVRGHDLERPGHQELAHVGARHQLGQERADLVHLGEALEHGHEPAVLALGELQVDDVVVQVVFAVPRRDGDQLAAGGVDQHGPERADFRSHVNAGHSEAI